MANGMTDEEVMIDLLEMRDNLENDYDNAKTRKEKKSIRKQIRNVNTQIKHLKEKMEKE